ncbi:hypothetical protein PM10SUCC1_37900 [Propionigenium maris DSM 9537]|uniref:Uncharacterized protein n=1 Tax=Propionigenium maris DSM 9537 TaxID=1123000 RepID=A0A9W6LPD8_9FUSO|nr:hypothetical protein PM10SUCC1_37900 [Propionigenium maris DSM 9537]
MILLDLNLTNISKAFKIKGMKYYFESDFYITVYVQKKKPLFYRVYCLYSYMQPFDNTGIKYSFLKPITIIVYVHIDYPLF